MSRLQKILAEAGVSSRRGSEELIRQGVVTVNGEPATLGMRANPTSDRIEVRGKPIFPRRKVYLILNKPREVVTSLSDPEGRPTVVTCLTGVTTRVFPVGRLDYHTSGALLLTNDGELAQKLLHPRHEVSKVYVAKIQGHPTERALQQLQNGVRLDDGYITRPARVYVVREDKHHCWLQVSLQEGKNRQLRRMCEAVGHPVRRLSRLSFAGITTDGLLPGQFRHLTEKEIRLLRS